MEHHGRVRTEAGAHDEAFGEVPCGPLDDFLGARVPQRFVVGFGLGEVDGRCGSLHALNLMQLVDLSNGATQNAL